MAPEKSPRARRPWRVLAVDDEPGMRRAIARSLPDRYLVDRAESAREAMDLVMKHHYDVAIVDVRMPEVDGFELLEALKVESPHTEVIMITGSRSDTTGKLLRAIGEKAFYFLEKPFDRAVLVALVDRAAEVSHLARENRLYLERLRAEARRLEGDLEKARGFQESLLPGELPQHRLVEVHARYVPDRKVGGDFYDYHQDQGRLGLALADVAGHGVSAALLTGMLKVHLEAAWEGISSPGEVLGELNRRWAGTSLERFATLFYGLVSREGEELVYASAGHPPAILLRADGRDQVLEATGLPIGPFPEAGYGERIIPLAAGDTLFLYTDGLTEAQNERGETLSGDHLRAVLEGQRTSNPRELLDAVWETLLSWVSPGEPTDDVTLIAARRI